MIEVEFPFAQRQRYRVQRKGAGLFQVAGRIPEDTTPPTAGIDLADHLASGNTLFSQSDPDLDAIDHLPPLREAR
jgi:hypothetical protein